MDSVDLTRPGDRNYYYIIIIIIGIIHRKCTIKRGGERQREGETERDVKLKGGRER